MEPSGALSFITATQRHLLLSHYLGKEKSLEKNILCVAARQTGQVSERFLLEVTYLMKKTRPSLQTPYDQCSGRVSRPRGAAMIFPLWLLGGIVPFSLPSNSLALSLSPIHLHTRPLPLSGPQTFPENIHDTNTGAAQFFKGEETEVDNSRIPSEVCAVFVI